MDLIIFLPGPFCSSVHTLRWRISTNANMGYNWTRLQKLPPFIPTYTELPIVDQIVEGLVLCL